MGSTRRWLVVAGIGGVLVPVVWWWRRRAVTEPTPARAGEDDRVVDEAIAESFPASDPPAYAGWRGGATDGR